MKKWQNLVVPSNRAGGSELELKNGGRTSWISLYNQSTKKVKYWKLIIIIGLNQ